MNKSILIVSDKFEVYGPVWLHAAGAGYEPSVVDRYQEVGRKISNTPPSVVLIDSEIQGTSAESLLRGLRLSLHTRRLPVIVAAPKGHESEHLSMFDAGADDLIGVPFSVKELFARVKAVTRPRAVKASPAPISVGTVALDVEARRILAGDNEKRVEVPLPPLAFEILRVLFTRAGATLTREEIASSVWGPATAAVRRVDGRVAYLRMILRRNRVGLQIDVVRGQGYRLAVENGASRVADGRTVQSAAPS